MKREMDLVRKILLAVEAQPHGFASIELDIDGYTHEQVAYHAHLMEQAGLVIATDTSHMESNSPEALISSITWEGHEFIDAAREPKRWQKAKDLLGDASIKVWITVLTKLTMDGLGM